MSGIGGTLPSALDILLKDLVDYNVRFSVDPDTLVATLEKLTDDIWQPNSLKLGPTCVQVGERVSAAGIGHHLAAEDKNGLFHFHAHSDFDPTTGLSISEAKMPHAYNFETRRILQSDNSGLYTGKNFESNFYAVSPVMTQSRYFQTGPTIPTSPVTIKIHEGIDAEGLLIFDQTYPPFDFPASSEITLSMDGYFETYAATTYFLSITCETDFSIKTNAGGTAPWVAVDDIDIREDDMLQVKPWKSGDSFTVGQWTIQNNLIYSCNVAGVQTGTFAENISKWDPLVNKKYVDLQDNRSLKTGIINGGALSIASATTINIAAGTGVVIDATNASNIIRTDVSWDEVLGYAPNLSLDGSNIILIDSSGTVSDIRNVDKTDETYRDYVILGTISIYMSMVIHADSRPYNLGYISQSFEDFARDVIGTSTIGGLVYSPNSTDLSLKYSSGRIFDIGCGFAIGAQNNPNEKDISGADAPVLFMTYHDGPTLYPDGGPTIFVNPNKIDNGDGTTSPVGNNKWTIQRIFYSPTATLVSYGQEEYGTYDLANDAMYSQEFFEAGALPASWFRAYLIINEGATDLSDTAQAVFKEAPKFRLSGAGGGAGAGGGVSAHSSLLKLEWDIAGHLFEDAGVFDIGNYTFLMADTFRNNAGGLILAKDDVATYPSIQNVINNFNSYTGLLIKKTDTGSGDYLQIKNSSDTLLFEIDTAGSLTLNDGTRDRIVSNPSYSAAYGPNGIYHLMVSNGHIALEDNHGPRVVADSTETMLFSPWDGSVIVLRDSGITIAGDLILNDDLWAGIVNATAIHFNLDDNVWKFQQDDLDEDPAFRLRQTTGNAPFYIDTDSRTIFRDALGVANKVTIYHSTGNMHVSGNTTTSGYFIAGPGATSDGQTLLVLNAYRNWEFQTEGTDGATDLRLRAIDGTDTDFNIDTGGSTRFRSKDGSSTAMEINHSTGDLTIDNILSSDFAVNDGTRERIKADTSQSALISPDGDNTVIVTDSGIALNASDSVRFSAGPTYNELLSPDMSITLKMTDTSIELKDSIVRVGFDAADTSLRSPDGTKVLTVDNTQIDIAGILDVTGYINSDSNIVAQGRLQSVSTDDGETLLQFETPRRWVFQQEGSGSAASLRLRNLLGQNKSFSIDTSGYSYWRTHDGVTTRMSFNHGNGNLWTAGRIHVGGDFDHDGANLGFFGTVPTTQPTHIVDADGTLEDITTKFNVLLAQMAATGLQASA